MAKCNVTYNGAIISSVDETTPITVNYGGSQITSISEGETKILNCAGKYMNANVGAGGKTLTCSGKLMNSNVIVEVEGGGIPMPAKGQIINVELSTITPVNNRLRVIRTDGNIAECVILERNFNYVKFDTPGSENYINIGEHLCRSYFGSLVDGYNDSFAYNFFTETAKNALAPKLITQDCWFLGTGGSKSYRNKYYKKSGDLTQTISKYEQESAGRMRSVYQLSIQDIVDYLETPVGGTIDYMGINRMIFDMGATTNGKPIWLRSVSADDTELVMTVSSANGRISNVLYSNESSICLSNQVVRLDLSKISWT